MSVYVERLIRAPIESVWNKSQQPDQHQRWDLRFTRIEYLDRVDATEPQRFRYTTRLGFGLAIRGDGESVGERDLPDGSRTSSLRFWSNQPISLIREGRGYWKYLPIGPDTRFLTSYDYETRFGAFGSVVDRAIFRPLIGWATAWSFDRLAMWLEDGVDPVSTARAALVHLVARGTFAFVFAYQGLVPKLLGPAPDEVRMLHDAGVPTGSIIQLLSVIGVGEIGFALVALLAWHRAFPAWVVVFGLIVTTFGLALTSPDVFSAAFNPIALNLGIIALAAIDLIVLPGAPDAGRCRRRPTQAAS